MSEVLKARRAVEREFREVDGDVSVLNFTVWQVAQRIYLTGELLSDSSVRCLEDNLQRVVRRLRYLRELVVEAKEREGRSAGANTLEARRRLERMWPLQTGERTRPPSP